MRPLVSVSIITYNHEAYLGECLESVLAQEGEFRLEVVVGEDQSTDGTRAVLRRYAERYPEIIRPLYHATNLGADRNWQAVLDQCRGEFIAHLDGDDLMLPGKLEAQSRWLSDNPSAAMVFHEMIVREGSSPASLRLFTGRAGGRVTDLRSLLQVGTAYCTSSVMFRGSAARGERIDPRIPHIVDWLFEMQVARHGTIGYIPDALGVYRRHPGSFTAVSWERRRRFVEEQLIAVEEVAGWPGMGEAADVARRRVMYGAAVSALEARDWNGFRTFITRAAAAGHGTSRGLALLARLRNWPKVAGLAWWATAPLRSRAR